MKKRLASPESVPIHLNVSFVVGTEGQKEFVRRVQDAPHEIFK